MYSFFIVVMSWHKKGVSGKLLVYVSLQFSSISDANIDVNPAILKPRLNPPHPANKSIVFISQNFR